jgi:hydroxymethylbilane synthase
LLCRYAADDASALALLATLDHAPTRLATAAERALLGHLEGGCQVPGRRVGRDIGPMA